MTDRQRTQAVLGVLAVFVGLGILLHLGPWIATARELRPVDGDTSLVGGFFVHVVAVTLLTMLAQAVRMDYRSRIRGQITLSLGIFSWSMILPFVAPDALIVGAVLGYLIDQVRTITVPIKGVFNVGMAYTTATVLLSVHQHVGGGDLIGASGWAAAIVSITSASIVQALALAPAMLIYEGGLDTTMTRTHAVTSTAIAAVMGMVAAISIELFTANPGALVLTLGMVATLAGGMRVLNHRGELVGELQDAVESMAHAERHDSLTGLPNRTAFLETVQTAIDMAVPAAVVLLDLNGFRDVNDTLGHEAGDRLLVDTGHRLGAVVRPGDAVARFGDDEFAVLVRDAFDPEVAHGAVRRLLAAIEQPHRGADFQIQTTASAGFALAGQHGADAITLTRRAELAMFAAKGRGEQVATYDDALEVDAPRRLRLASDLRTGLAAGELWVAYQPKLDLVSGNVLGVEALCRWDHPQDGPISPDEFIAIAERTGLIRDLTRRVLARALDDARTWRDQGVDLTVAVNVSPNVLGDEGFASHLAEEILRTGTSASSLTLEVTETVVLNDSVRMEQTLRRIEELGVKLAIDDYGTGYSSLSYLRRLRVHELKVDRSFVGDMVTNANDAVLVDSTIKLGHALGLTVVAEGVEDRETLQRLRIMGCDRAQGYHIARPMPSADLFTFALAHDASAVFAAP